MHGLETIKQMNNDNKDGERYYIIDGRGVWARSWQEANDKVNEGLKRKNG